MTCSSNVNFMKIKYFTRSGFEMFRGAGITTNLHYLMDTVREDLSRTSLVQFALPFCSLILIDCLLILWKQTF